MNAYDYSAKKTVVLLASNLEIPTALNVMGHLTLAIGAHADNEIMGRLRLSDASGVSHFGISRYPVIALKARAGKVHQAALKARELADVILVEYPRAMLETGHDDELANAISETQEENLDYLGLAAYGPSSLIDEVFGRFTLWRMD